MSAAQHSMKIEGELRAPVASARLVRFHFEEPVDNVLQGTETYRVDMCLSPRPGNARARYPARREARRFERIGNVFMVPPRETLQAVSDGCCEQASIICEFDVDRMGEWLDTDLEWTDSALLAGLDIRDVNIRMLLERLVREARQPGFASEFLTELVVAQLSVELARYCLAAPASESAGALAGWRLRLIDERLREEAAAPTLGELAGLCGLSVRQLTRGFRSSRGCSVGDYIAQLRIERARDLLVTGDSVKSVAYTLGFASPSSFCYAFRRATGETPGQFRERRSRGCA